VGNSGDGGEIRSYVFTIQSTIMSLLSFRTLKKKYCVAELINTRTLGGNICAYQLQLVSISVDHHFR